MKRFLLLLTLTLMAVSSQAQLLWKVSGNGLPKDSYILGTRHDIQASFLNMIPGMDTALENCEMFIAETIGESSNSDEFKSSLFVASDSTLDKLFSPDDYRFVMEKLGECFGLKKDLTSTEIASIKPFALIALMTSPLTIDFYASTGEVNMDSKLEERAADKGIPMMCLETHEFQQKLLTDEYMTTMNLPLTTQAMVLLEYCKNLDDNVESFLLHYGAYISQRLEWYERFNYDNDESVIARNKDWIPKLLPAMKEKSCLVAVGMAHLAGDEGLLQLLRKKGYTVEPMK